MTTLVSPRADQFDDLVWLIRDRKALYLSEPGTGKTIATVLNQWRRWSNDKVRTVWVMPSGLMKKNRDEILRFTDFKPEDVVIVDGTPKQVAKQLAQDGKVLLMGRQRFRLVWEQLPRDFKACDVDEYHLCFGGGTSKVTAAYHNFLRRAGKDAETVIMTATLVNGRYDSAWSAIHAMDPRYYPLGYEQFMARHAVCDDYGKPMFWQDVEKLEKIIGKHSRCRTFKSIFGEQEIVHQMETCALSPKQKKLYDQFEAIAMLELDRFMVDGTNPGVATIRAGQLLDHPRMFPDLTVFRRAMLTP